MSEFFGIGEAGKVEESAPMDEIETERLQPSPSRAKVKCSCGHTVPAVHVMSTSRGSSCPDCYDRMED
jgi:hypothetical protein